MLSAFECVAVSSPQFPSSKCFENFLRDIVTFSLCTGYSICAKCLFEPCSLIVSLKTETGLRGCSLQAAVYNSKKNAS